MRLLPVAGRRRTASLNLLPQRPRLRRVPARGRAGRLCRSCADPRIVRLAAPGSERSAAWRSSNVSHDAREPEPTACVVVGILEEEHMPVILLWAIPTIIVIGGGGYWLMHLHH
jgi:hypothetical protein